VTNGRGMGMGDAGMGLVLVEARDVAYGVWGVVGGHAATVDVELITGHFCI